MIDSTEESVPILIRKNGNVWQRTNRNDFNVESQLQALLYDCPDLIRKEAAEPITQRSVVQIHPRNQRFEKAALRAAFHVCSVPRSHLDFCKLQRTLACATLSMPS